MNLAEMLCYADIHQLNRIAKSYRCHCNENSKNELIQSILFTVLSRDSFEAQMDSLEKEDIQFVQSLILDTRGLFSLEELLSRAKQSLLEGVEGRSPREMITNLTQKGWLFNGISHQTKSLFQIPEDVKKKIINALRNRIILLLQKENEPEYYRDEQGLIREDIMIFMKYIHQNEIMLTSDGGIYKRQQQAILDQMHVKEEPIRHRGWRFGYGRRFRDYPDRLSFVYDFCFYSGYIQEDEMRLTLTPSGQIRVIEGQYEDMAAIYKMWLRLYRGPIRNLQILVRLLDLVGDSWITVSSIQQWLKEYVKAYYYDDPDSIIEKRIVQMMFHLGLLKVGHSEASGTVLKMTETGHRLIHGIAIREEEIIHVEEKDEEPEFKL